MELVGFHCHVGSQVFAEDVFERAAVIMLEFAAHMEKAHGYQTRQLDLGGGYGVRYVECDPVLDVDAKVAQVAAAAKGSCARLGIALPEIHMEPGRSIVGDAGLTLYTVGTVKEIPGYKNYVSVDGGMPDNPRFALYGASYTCLLANKLDPGPPNFPARWWAAAARAATSSRSTSCCPGAWAGETFWRYAPPAPTTTPWPPITTAFPGPPLSCSGAATSPMWQSAGSPWRICAATTCKKRTRERPHRGPLPSSLLKTCFRQAAGLLEPFERFEKSFDPT